MRRQTERPTLSPDECRLILAEARPHLRQYTAYALGLRAGLRAVEVSALDLGHVSDDGLTIRDSIIIVRGRRKGPVETSRALPSDLQEALGRYLSWRRSCPHFRRPMRTYRDERGIERCRVCNDVMDVLHCPLFRSREGGRLSPSRLWHEFAELRARLGLSPSLQFSCLRNTCFGDRTFVLEAQP